MFPVEFNRIQSIENELAPKRVLVVYGPLRIGKTTQLQAFLEKKKNEGKKILSVVGDDIGVRDLFASESQNRIMQFAEPWDIIAIDEAQYVPNIGRGAKMLIDAMPEKTIILTGSSSFELSGQVGEPLTGRHFVMTLLPVSVKEIVGGTFIVENNLSDMLIFGAYPEILLAGNPDKKRRILFELLSSYLYKDILVLDNIRSPDRLRDLTRALALQIGKEVSLSELGRMVSGGMSVKTVARYLDVLEKMFVVKKVGGWSGNMRNEITRKAKYYFLDLGVRNAVIEQFQSLEYRNDVGALWENFVFMELYKKSVREKTEERFYFWRTHAGDEMDIVREHNGILTGIEAKWGKSVGVQKKWRIEYPKSAWQCITRDNFDQYLF